MQTQPLIIKQHIKSRKETAFPLWRATEHHVQEQGLPAWLSSVTASWCLSDASANLLDQSTTDWFIMIIVVIIDIITWILTCSFDVVQHNISTGRRKTFPIIHQNESTTLSFCMKDNFIPTSATLSWRHHMHCSAIWHTMIWKIQFQSWSSLRHSAIIWWDGRPPRYVAYERELMHEYCRHIIWLTYGTICHCPLCFFDGNDGVDHVMMTFKFLFWYRYILTFSSLSACAVL